MLPRGLQEEMQCLSAGFHSMCGPAKHETSVMLPSLPAQRSCLPGKSSPACLIRSVCKTTESDLEHRADTHQSSASHQQFGRGRPGCIPVCKGLLSLACLTTQHQSARSIYPPRCIPGCHGLGTPPYARAAILQLPSIELHLGTPPRFEPTRRAAVGVKYAEHVLSPCTFM